MLEQIRDIAQKICGFSGVDSGPLVMEFKLSGGRFYCIEAAFEAGGEYLADFLLPVCAGYNYFENLVRIFTGDTDRVIMPDPLAEKKFGLIGFRLTEPEKFPVKTSLIDYLTGSNDNEFCHTLPGTGKTRSKTVMNPFSGNDARVFVYGISDNTEEGILKKLYDLSR